MKYKRQRVSIVIPAHNEERYLPACLEALAAQTVRPDEVIVVDNASTDRTAAIAARYPFVKVVHEKRRGRVYARSAGFDASSGDIIGRIDADCVLPLDWVEHIKQFYALERNAREAWSGGPSFYNVPLTRLVGFAYELLAYRFSYLLLGHYTLWGSNMAITREQWQAVRKKTCMRLDIHEDLDLAIHLAQAGFGITYDPLVKVPAELRRIQSNRHELWEYLQWWPRTIRVHGNPAWLICWIVGGLMLYLAALLLVVIDKAKHLLKRPVPVRLPSAD